ncbi:MAG: glutathione S-transferase family protein [Alphaproteobacteria bacterium]|nr:glutathione S-transferase family protein [Alphaproteobacteria bacterium]
MIEAIERQHAEPSITPDEPSLAFIAALLEDYADEWLNKAMFHYRWSYPDDQESASNRIVEMIFEGAAAPEGMAESVRTRMVGRLHHVGSSPDTAPIIEGSFNRASGAVEKLLGSKPYLFGGRPSLADFGLAAQFGQLLSDPTPGAILRAQAPKLVAWVERMDAPKVEGEFVRFSDVRDDLVELLRDEVAGAYFIWAAANAAAVADDARGVAVEIAGHTFTQKPQRYAAKALAELKNKRAGVEDEVLAALLAETGVDTVLQSANAAQHEAADDDGHVSDDDGDEGGDEGEE